MPFTITDEQKAQALTFVDRKFATLDKKLLKLVTDRQAARQIARMCYLEGFLVGSGQDYASGACGDPIAPAEEIEFMLVDDVATRFKVTPYTVREWIKAGKLKAVRAGRRLLIKTADVEALIKE